MEANHSWFYLFISSNWIYPSVRTCSGIVFLYRVTGCPEELKTWRGGRERGGSKPVLEHPHLFCGTGSLWGWGCGVEPLDKSFLPRQSPQMALSDKSRVPISFSHNRHTDTYKWEWVISFFLYSSEKSAMAQICFPTQNTWIELIILPPLFQ